MPSPGVDAFAPVSDSRFTNMTRSDVQKQKQTDKIVMFYLQSFLCPLFKAQRQHVGIHRAMQGSKTLQVSVFSRLDLHKVHICALVNSGLRHLKAS